MTDSQNPADESRLDAQASPQPVSDLTQSERKNTPTSCPEEWDYEDLCFIRSSN